MISREYLKGEGAQAVKEVPFRVDPTAAALRRLANIIDHPMTLAARFVSDELGDRMLIVPDYALLKAGGPYRGAGRDSYRDPRFYFHHFENDFRAYGRCGTMTDAALTTKNECDPDLFVEVRDTATFDGWFYRTTAGLPEDRWDAGAWGGKGGDARAKIEALADELGCEPVRFGYRDPETGRWGLKAASVQDAVMLRVGLA